MVLKCIFFEVHRAGVYTYVGPVRLAGEPYESRQPDLDGATRTVWIFPVRPIALTKPLPGPADALQKTLERQRKDAARLSDDEIATRATLRSGPASSRAVVTSAYVRNEYVAEHARRRAGGKCELCDQAAPFVNRTGEPYLETHHLAGSWRRRQYR